VAAAALFCEAPAGSRSLEWRHADGLQVWAQAAALLGEDGADMAEECLPAQLRAQAWGSAERLAGEQLQGSCYRGVQAWLDAVSAQEADGQGWQASRVMWSPRVPLPGVWVLQATGPHGNDAASASAGRADAQHGAGSSAQRVVLVVCAEEWCSTNEPFTVMGSGLLQKQLALALAGRQDPQCSGSSSGGGGALEHAPQVHAVCMVSEPTWASWCDLPQEGKLARMLQLVEPQ